MSHQRMRFLSLRIMRTAPPSLTQKIQSITPTKPHLIYGSQVVFTLETSADTRGKALVWSLVWIIYFFLMHYPKRTFKIDQQQMPCEFIFRQVVRKPEGQRLSWGCWPACYHPAMAVSCSTPTLHGKSCSSFLSDLHSDEVLCCDSPGPDDEQVWGTGKRPQLGLLNLFW